MKYTLNLYGSKNEPIESIKNLTSWNCSVLAYEKTDEDSSITCVEMVDEDGVSSGLVQSHSFYELYNHYQQALKNVRDLDESTILTFTQFVNESIKKFTYKDFENAANDFLNTETHDEYGWSRYEANQSEDVQNEPSKTILAYFRNSDLIALRNNIDSYDPIKLSFERYKKGFKAHSNEDDIWELQRIKNYDRKSNRRK